MENSSGKVFIYNFTEILEIKNFINFGIVIYML